MSLPNFPGRESCLEGYDGMNVREGGRGLEESEGKELPLLEEYVMIDGMCWQRYGSKLVGPEGKTGREEEYKQTHFYSIPFLAVRFSRVLAFALSCVWRCVVVNSYRSQQAVGVAAESALPASGVLPSRGRGRGELQRVIQKRAAKRASLGV